MKIEIDIEKIMSTSKDIDIEIERLNEIMKNFFSLAESFATSSTWIGVSSANYSKYLLNKKRNYDALYNSLVSFNTCLKRNVKELDYALTISKVNKDD